MNIRLILFFMVFCSITWSGTALSAPVKSMSLEVFNDGETRFWEVLVSCETVEQPRSMRRSLDSDLWCSTDAKNLCDKNKFSLSRQLCNDNFSDQVTTQAVAAETPFQTKLNTSADIQSASVAKDTETVAILSDSIDNNKEASYEGSSRESLLNEKLQIEEQSILIQQRRLELRRRELSLQKQQLNTN